MFAADEQIVKALTGNSSGMTRPVTVREAGGWTATNELSLFLLDGQGQQLEALGHSMGDAGGATYHAKGGTNSLRISSDEHCRSLWSSYRSETAHHATDLIAGNQISTHLGMSEFNGEHSAKDTMCFMPGFLRHAIALCIGFTFVKVRVTVPSRLIRYVS